MRDWIVKQWALRRGSLSLVDIVLIVQSVWWGGWMIAVDPPIHLLMHETYGWQQAFGGSLVAGICSLTLGVGVLACGVSSRLHPYKVIPLAGACLWWGATAYALSGIDWRLPSIPVYSTLAVTALLAYASHPPPDREHEGD